MAYTYKTDTVLELQPLTPHFEGFQDDSFATCCCFQNSKSCLAYSAMVMHLVLALALFIFYGISWASYLTVSNVFFALGVYLLPALLFCLFAHFCRVIALSQTKFSGSRNVNIITFRTMLSLAIFHGLLFSGLLFPTGSFFWSGLIHTGVNGCYDACGPAIILFILLFLAEIVVLVQIVLLSISARLAHVSIHGSGAKDLSACTLFGMLISGNITP
jgi:hypothetical protein